MPRSTKWINLTIANKVIFVLTMVALFLLVLGFSTPFWILISVDFNYGNRRNRDVLFLFELYEKEYIGLWQWCLKHYGCIDLSLVAKYFSYTKYIRERHRIGILDKIIIKTSRIIDLWTVSRSCATVAVICAILISIWKLYYIWIRKMNHIRVYHIVSIVENFIIGSALLACLVTFGVAIQTFDEVNVIMISEWNIGRNGDINRYFFISFWMVCAATIMYFSNGILAVVSLCRGYVINTKAASRRRSIAATRC